MQQITIAALTRYTRGFFAFSEANGNGKTHAAFTSSEKISSPRLAEDNGHFAAEFAALRLPESREAVQRLLATLRDMETSLGAAPR